MDREWPVPFRFIKRQQEVYLGAYCISIHYLFLVFLLFSALVSVYNYIISMPFILLIPTQS